MKVRGQSMDDANQIDQEITPSGLETKFEDGRVDVSFEIKIPKELIEGGDVQAYADELVRKHENKEEERLNYDFQTIASELIDAWGHDKFKEMVGKFSEKEV